MGNHCSDYLGVTLIPILSACLLQQFSHHVLPQEAQQFNFTVSDVAWLIGSHIKKENLKGSCDHMIPPWGRNAG